MRHLTISREYETIIMYKKSVKIIVLDEVAKRIKDRYYGWKTEPYNRLDV